MGKGGCVQPAGRGRPSARSTSSDETGRIVVLGAGGFIGRALTRALERRGEHTVALHARSLELSSGEGGARLARELRRGDVLIVLAAITRDRGNGPSELRANLAIGRAVCEALSPCRKVIYLSSDAVYPFGVDPITEGSCAGAEDLYGAMHRTRELMLESVVRCPLVILRPTHVYGPGNTHDQYGPDRMLRTAFSDGCIEVFGRGDDSRDYLWIGDAVAATLAAIDRPIEGTVNLAAGDPCSYIDLARRVAGLFEEEIEIRSLPRTASRRERRFDLGECRRVFPEIELTPLSDGLTRARDALGSQGRSSAAGTSSGRGIRARRGSP